MLQRIQTIYLLISTILISVSIFIPIFEFNSMKYVFHTYGIIETGIDANTVHSQVNNTIIIAILLTISALFTLISIFLYKKRIMQMRFTVISIILLLSFYFLVAIYRFFIFDIEITSTTFSIGLIIPLIASILNYIANRKIKKDEDLVRSVDRIR
jgi:presenilin-like A22 family membrane protease